LQSETTRSNAADPLLSLIRGLGSLWLAAMLLILLLVAMACATIYEAAHGTEQAQVVFYKSWWFELLLWLLGANVLLSLLLRFPFSKRQIGFVITHVSILLILVGALVTKVLAVYGRVTLSEGQSTSSFFDSDRDELTIRNMAKNADASIVLPGSVFHGFKQATKPTVPALGLEDVHVAVEEFLPDSRWERTVANDNDSFNPAVRLTLSPDDFDSGVWVFPDQQGSDGTGGVRLSVVSDEAEWSAITHGETPVEKPEELFLRVQYKEDQYEFRLEECQKQPQAIGHTGITVRVLRYLPHAQVGQGGKLRNISDQAENPAVEVEIAAPQGSETRYAFSKYPEMQFREHLIEDLRLTFVATAPPPLVEALVAPFSPDTFIRFAPGGIQQAPIKIEPQQPVATPWHGEALVLLERLDHTSFRWSLTPIEPPRDTRIPAIRLAITSGAETANTWLQRHKSKTLELNSQPYELVYTTKRVPMDFDLKLDKFKIGRYPGSMRPRSFSSTVIMTDQQTGRSETREISMNRPTTFGGYTFFQSGYDEQVMTSTLSISSDPGQPIVFLGYITLMGGTVVVLGIRIGERRKGQAAVTAQDVDHPATARSPLAPPPTSEPEPQTA
jgi:hypothetical protein